MATVVSRDKVISEMKNGARIIWTGGISPKAYLISVNNEDLGSIRLNTCLDLIKPNNIYGIEEIPSSSLAKEYRIKTQ